MTPRSIEPRRSTPDNPFLVSPYFRAQRDLGQEALLLGVRTAGSSNVRGSGLSQLRPSSYHADRAVCATLAADSPFWHGLVAFAGIAASPIWIFRLLRLPNQSSLRLPGEHARIQRAEYALSLKGADILAGLSKHHRERIKKARKRSLVLRKEDRRASARCAHRASRTLNGSPHCHEANKCCRSTRARHPAAVLS